MADKISLRMQTPADPITGKRKDIHPITTDEEVIVNVNGSPETLYDYLNSRKKDFDELASNPAIILYEEGKLPDINKPSIFAKIIK